MSGLNRIAEAELDKKGKSSDDLEKELKKLEKTGEQGSDC